MRNSKKSKPLEARKHSDFSASASERWLNLCPGSVILSRGLESEDSFASKEGTAAHELAALCLKEKISPLKIRIGTKLEDEHLSFINDEMRFEVNKYFKHVMPFFDIGDVYIEEKFDLSWLAPDFLTHMDEIEKGEFAPEGKFTMFGTGDVVVVEPWGDIHVIDLKYGKGKIVEATDNSQLAFYGIGGADKGFWDFENIHLSIYQPRRDHYPKATLSNEALRDWTKVFRSAVIAIASEPEFPNLIPGKQCQYCPAKNVCPARSESIDKSLSTHFADTKKLSRDPKLLSPEQISQVLNNAKVVEDWLSGVRAQAMRLLEQGDEVPGYKLVNKRGERVWQNYERLAGMLRKNPKAFTRPELLSPAQMEKVMGKKFVAKHAVKINKPGRTLARDDDRREKLLPSVDEAFSDWKD